MNFINRFTVPMAVSQFELFPSKKFELFDEIGVLNNVHVLCENNSSNNMPEFTVLIFHKYFKIIHDFLD